MSDVKRLVFAIADFLDQQARTNAVSGEALESLEVGLQCIQTAYGINLEDPIQAAELRTGHSLLDVFTSKTSAKKPDATKAKGASFTPTGLVSASASKLDCEKAEKLKNEGNDLMKKEMHNEAVNMYTQAIDLNPTKAVYYSNRAAAYSKLDNHEKALEDCRKAVEIDPTYSKAYGRMGLAYSSLNEFQKACDAYTRAVDLEPTNTSYQTNLEIAQKKLKETSLGGGGGAADLTGGLPGGLPNAGGLGPTLGGMDMGQLMNNPAIMNAATSFLQNPQMQQMMQSFMGQAMQPGNQADSGGNMANLLSVGQQLASQIQQTNPQLVEQLRQMRSRGDVPNPTNNNQEGTGDNQDQPPSTQ